MFSNKQLISLSIPVIIDALLSMAVGLVDSVMVASVGSEAVSAVSLADSILSFFILIQNSLAVGGGVVAAQYVGRGDYESARRAAKQTLYITVLFSAIVMALLLIFTVPLLRLIYGELDPTVFDYCKTYFFWIVLGFPVAAVGTVCATMLRSQANTKFALYLAGAINILNAIGNAILIYGFDMGVAGAAISTTFARVVYCVLGVLILRNREAPIYLSKIWKVRFEKDMFRRVMSIGVANGIEGGLSQLGSILNAMLIASLGTATVAVISITTKIGGLAWSLVSALQIVVMTVVGHCIGAGEIEQAKMYTKKFTLYANIATFSFFSLLIIFRNQIVLLYDLDASLLSECAKQLFYASAITILTFYGRAFIPLSSFRAAGDTKYAVSASLIGMFIGRVVLSYVFVAWFKLGSLGIWMGMGIYHLICAVFSTARLRSGKWLTKKVI